MTNASAFILISLVATNPDFLFKPICEKSKAFAAFLGKDHLVAKDLNILRDLGFEITLKDFFENELF